MPLPLAKPRGVRALCQPQHATSLCLKEAIRERGTGYLAPEARHTQTEIGTRLAPFRTPHHHHHNPARPPPSTLLRWQTKPFCAFAEALRRVTFHSFLSRSQRRNNGELPFARGIEGGRRPGRRTDSLPVKSAPRRRNRRHAVTPVSLGRRAAVPKRLQQRAAAAPAGGCPFALRRVSSWLGLLSLRYAGCLQRRQAAQNI